MSGTDELGAEDEEDDVDEEDEDEEEEGCDGGIMKQVRRKLSTPGT